MRIVRSGWLFWGLVLAFVFVLAPGLANAALTITTSSPLPPGTVGLNYSAVQLTATGGQSVYSWIVLSGTLPPGISLSSGGMVSGAPTAAGTYTFTVQVSDKPTGMTGSKQFSISIPQITT